MTANPDVIVSFVSHDNIPNAFVPNGYNYTYVVVYALVRLISTGLRRE